LKGQLKDDFWPPPLRHRGRPLLSSVDEEVTMGEISGEPVDSFVGNRMLFTALVPLEEVDTVSLAHSGA